jgi:hypothetical protein
MNLKKVYTIYKCSQYKEVPMRKTILMLVMVLFVVGSVSAAVIQDSRDAMAFVSKRLLSDNLDGVRVYVMDKTIEKGDEIYSWKHLIYSAPSEGWLVFIDDLARANWEHPCRFVHVDRTGHMDIFKAVTPPLNMEEFIEMDTPMKRIADAAHTVIPVPYDGPIKSTGVKDGGTNYAILVSGGASQWSNYIRYYNDIAFIYTTLTEVYGYTNDRIFVLMSDGTDPSPDRSDGTNSPPDIDGDGEDDVDYPAEMWAINEVFDQLADVVTENDQIFYYSTDHGGTNGGWNVYENLWNWETMSDATFASLVNSLPAATFVFTMEQCYSGGFEDNLQDRSPRVFSSACRYNQYSWAMSNLIYDEYVYYWTSAIRGEDPYGNPVDADYNEDGQVTMDEAFDYAYAHDTRDEEPQYDDNPVGLGAGITLGGGSSYPSFSLEVSNYPYLVMIGTRLSWDVNVRNNGDTGYPVDLWVEITSDSMTHPYYKLVSSFTADAGQSYDFHLSKIVPLWVPIDFYDIKTCVGLYHSDIYASDTFEVILIGS